MTKTKLIAAFVIILSVIPFAGCQTEIKTPGIKLQADVSANRAGRLTYQVDRGNSIVIERSPLGITVDGVDLGDGVTVGPAKQRIIEETYATRGVHSTAVNNCLVNRIPITHKATNTNYILETRTFRDGFAFRYIVPGSGTRTVNGEATAWKLPKGSKVWAQKSSHNYEELYRKLPPENLSEGSAIVFPVTVELADGTYISLTEAAVFNYSGMTVQSTGTAMLKAIFEDDKDGFSIEGAITTPWRVVMTGPTLNDLVNSDIVTNLCPKPDKELFPDGINTEWIKPGRGLWHWWSEEDPSFERHKSWVDATTILGLDYYLVDESWGAWKDGDRDKWDMLEEFVEYAKDRNVGVWVWKAYPDRNNVPGIFEKTARMAFLKRCSQLGVKGVKIDFMETESKDLIDFYEDVLKEAAGFKLMINFHGANKPTGESRTYPNEMTREGVRGLEWNKWSKLPRQFYATIPFTRYLAGHGDFTPCTFNPEFLKGTTFTTQLASIIMYTSPVYHLADRPKYYLASPAREIIENIPSTWDETVVLNRSEIGKLAAFARRKGDEWFVAIINGSSEQRFYELDTSFLAKGLYKATTARDVIAKPTEMNVKTMMINSGDTLPIQMNPGGGFVARFSTKTADMKWWRDGRFGMFIHWGPVSIKGTEIGWSRGKQIPVEEYDQLYKQFNPKDFDAAEWVSLAKEAGMKYIVITAKHHDGFCLWDSKYTDYDIMSTPFGRDILKELSDECKKQDIKFCVYYSVLDWYHPDYNTIGNQGGAGYKLPAGVKPDINRYVTYMKNQLEEIIENYGPVGILWFDGAWEKQWTHEHGKIIYDHVKNLQPSIIINNRVDKGFQSWVGKTKEGFLGDYDTPEQQIGEFQLDRPWETCMTIGKQWAYKPDDELKSAKECIQALVRTVGGDGNLLLNVGPRPDGTIDPGQAEVLRQMGQWLDYNKFAIYKTRGGPYMPGSWGASTHNRRSLFLHVLDWGGNTISIASLKYKMRDVTVHKPINFKYRYDWTDEGNLEIVLADKYHDDIDTVISLTPMGPPKNMEPIEHGIRFLDRDDVVE